MPNMSKKIKILVCGVLPPPYYGPSLTYESLMSSRFSTTFDVLFVSTNLYEAVGEIGKGSVHKLFLSLKYSLILGHSFVRHRPNYVLITASFNRLAFLKNCIFLFVPWLSRARIVQYAHDDSLRHYYANASAFLKRFLRWYVTSSHAWIVLGNTLKANFVPRFPSHRIMVVESGIIPFISKKEAQERTINRRSTPFRVLFLGNLLEEKGFFDVIKTAPSVIAALDQVNYMIAGDWSPTGLMIKDSVVQFIESNNIGDKVEFLGRVTGDRKKEILLSANVLVFPTRYDNETFGLVNIEAMQAGLPVITTSKGAIPEIVENGTNGFIVDAEDIQTITQKILLLQRDPSLCTQIGLNNIEKFWRMYTNVAFGERMISAFHYLHSLDLTPFDRQGEKPVSSGETGGLAWKEARNGRSTTGSLSLML